MNKIEAVKLIGLASVLLTVGCGVHPRPQPVVPFTMTDTFSESGAEPLPQQWWHAFDDPRLDDLIEEGVMQNFSIRIAWDRLRQARQTAIKAGANLYPEVNYSGDAQRTYLRSDAANNNSSAWAVGLSAAYEADLWGRVQSVSEAARLDALAAREDVDAAAITLSAAIAQTWYELMEAKLQQQLVTSQLEANEKVLTIIRLQFRQGQTGAADVFRQEQLVEATRGQLVLVQEAIALLQHSLSVLLGRPPALWWADDAPLLAEMPPLPEAGIPSELVRRRPDLRSAAAVIQSADYRVSAAVADRYPRVLLVGATETSADRFRDLFDDWLSVLAANIAGPVFDAGFRRAEVERTRAVLSQAINNYGQETLLAFQEVEDALSREVYQWQYIQSLRNQLALARKTYDSVRENYLRGQIDYIRVLESLVSRQTLERSLLTARRQRIEFRIDLYRALAGGWELEIPEPAQLETEPMITEVIHDGTETSL